MAKKGEENQKSDTAKREEEILAFWNEHNIFEKTLEKDSPEGEFVFYEGPPTANNHPAIHHLEARAFKDLIPRYKTMRGFHVRRKAGWDTHGLPVELEVEKELGLKNKKDIEEYGIEAFNKKCKESVLRYIDEWKEFTDRIGFWVDHASTYFTFDNNYIESVWHIIKRVYERGLLYKDYRVVPWCARCGTPLSSHEVADGYKTIADTSVIVKFETRNPKPETNTKDFRRDSASSPRESARTYVLAWTTTPWTLPGNVALAVGEDIDYAVVRAGKGLTLRSPEGGKRSDLEERAQYIVAKDLLGKVFGDDEYEIVEEKKGSELVGIEYEPLFDIPALQSETSHKVYAADFVSTDEGTGIVHTAVMYGQDDFELGTRENLPKHHLVGEDGKFGDEAVELAGINVFDANEKVIKTLKEKDLLFDTEEYEHSYPHCWRCKEKLIYYARDSWFIKMSELRDELVKENEDIHWEPEHIRDGRFGEWLKDVKDWAISRNRYWGTPLPVWVGEESGNLFVPGSIDELKEHTKKSGNTYFLMRHGEAKGNEANTFESGGDPENTLTEKGREQVRAGAEELKGKEITKIYASPFVRARETAELVAEAIGIPKNEVVHDERLREFDLGKFDGAKVDEGFWDWQKTAAYKDAIPGGESYFEAKNRFAAFMYELEREYSDEKVLIVSHGVAFESIPILVAGAGGDLAKKMLDSNMNEAKEAEVRKVNFAPLPHNEHYELDLHRPYIDEIEVEKGGEKFARAEEVLDVWFDSGSMPFAQDHYPFDFAQGKLLENKELSYPADFISEAIDQTRGWFYTLHAIGILMERGKAYEHVISLGHLLDKDGKKMSKSVGNVIDPWDQIAKYGVDALRFWMYTVNEPGNSKNFDERSVDEIVKKNITRLLNVVKFYELYANNLQPTTYNLQPTNVLDKWIIARLNALIRIVTENLDVYKVDKAARPIAEFIDDLSTWYIRRSRDRFKQHGTNTRMSANDTNNNDTNNDDKQAALRTTHYVLHTFSKVLAPFMPFIAEDIYQRVVRGMSNVEGTESVHLEDWPDIQATSYKLQATNILEDMAEVRRVVSLGLEARTEAGIKVRQPLASLKVKLQATSYKIQDTNLVELIKEEVNVKEVVFGESIKNEVELDTEITPELKREGQARELIRAIQNMRKNAGLVPDDHITLTISTSAEGQEVVKAHEDTIKKTVLADDIQFTENSGEEVKVDNLSFFVGLNTA